MSTMRRRGSSTRARPTSGKPRSSEHRTVCSSSAITSVSNLTSVTANILGATRPSIQGDIAGLKSLADQINKRDADIEETLTNLPIKLQKIGRAATFGSWFQFYLCGIDVVAGNGKAPLLTQPLVPLPDINHVLYTSAATRCWADEKPGG